MSWRKVAKCDSCGKTVSFAIELNSESILSFFKSQGWQSISGHTHTCPDCKPTKYAIVITDEHGEDHLCAERFGSSTDAEIKIEEIRRAMQYQFPDWTYTWKTI